MIVLRLVAFVAGAVVVFAVLSSAVRTVVVPRGERLVLNAFVFTRTRSLFHWWAERTDDEETREQRLARFAPTALLMLPLAWVIGVIVGFVPIYWALGIDSWREALITSGSSVTTVGFSRPDEIWAVEAAFVEAIIGLALVALLISFLPTIYGHFSRREAAVARFEVRAGAPPSPVELLSRANRIGVLEGLTEVWSEWEYWFVDLEESHTSFPALVWFRSPVVGRSWITAAGASLDAAAISLSTLEIESRSEASLFIRSGFLSLRRVASFFDIAFEPDPRPGDAVSVTQDEFNEVYERLAAEHLPMKPDREQAWRDFAGWRVNYDAPLLGLCALVQPPSAMWSSDRAPDYVRMPVFRRHRHKLAHIEDIEPRHRYD